MTIRFSDKVMNARQKQVRAGVRDAGADALLVVNPPDIRYLTGFVGDDSWLLLPARSGKPVILSDFRFEEQIAREAPGAQAVIRKGKMIDALKKAIAGRKSIDKLAIQADHVTVAQRRGLVKAMSAGRLIETAELTHAARQVKVADEIKLIRRALKIQQEAYLDTIGSIKPGQTEAEVAAFLEYRMRTLGADGTSFPTIVAADANAALPHAIPGQAKIKRGGIVLIDWGARYRGYCSDLTRVVGVGGMSKKMREVYAVVLEAQQAGIEAVGPGKTFKEVDAAARSVIEAAGYGERFGHSLGHGIGLDVHEEPRLSSSAEGELAEGMVVTVEPGIYLPGVGGVRIEDDVAVTSRGGEVLSELPKSLESAII